MRAYVYIKYMRAYVYLRTCVYTYLFILIEFLFISGFFFLFLLQLLAPDIRRERNVVLQCIRYIIHKEFFGLACKDSNPMLLQWHWVLEYSDVMSCLVSQSQDLLYSKWTKTGNRDNCSVISSFVFCWSLSRHSWLSEMLTVAQWNLAYKQGVRYYLSFLWTSVPWLILADKSNKSVWILRLFVYISVLCNQHLIIFNDLFLFE